jgi:hypothetical protein
VYAQLCAQAFAERLLATLPRELRDMIYRYVVLASSDRVTCAFVPRAHKKRWLGGHSDYGPFCSDRSFASPTTPYFLNKVWFGEELTYEVTTSIYTLATMTVTHQEDLSFCLTRDVFRNGVLPRRHIRALDVTLTSEAYDQEDFDYKIGGRNEQDPRRLAKAVRWLNALLGLPEPAKVRVQIWVKATSKSVAAQLEELMTPLVIKMRSRNCEMLVLHDLDKEYGPCAEHTFEFPRVTPFASD